MSFTAFDKTIKSPELKRVARHWNEVCGSREMPGWTDLKPAQIAAQLPITWSYKYDRTTGVFTGRLAGDKIAQVWEKSFRGLPIAELYPKEVLPIVIACFIHVVSEPALYVCEGTLFSHRDHHAYGERIIMPLADDGIHADGLLGATKYNTLGCLLDPSIPLNESWFSL